MSTRNIRIAVFCAIFICLVYGYLFLLSGTTTASDADECVDIVNTVEAENTLPKSISQPSRPAVFCGLDLRLPFLRQLDRVSIYGVVDGRKQDAIIATLQAYRQRTHTKPLL